MSDPVVEASNNVTTSLKFLTQNATHLCQPLDLFSIQELKVYWRKQWEARKIELIRDNQWSVRPRASRKLLNPSERFFMLPDIESVAHINSLVDNDEMPLVCKAMARCGLSLNSTGKWEKTQLFQHLQDTIDKHRLEFERSESMYHQRLGVHAFE